MDSHSTRFNTSLQADALLPALNKQWREALQEYALALSQASRGVLPAAWRPNPLEAQDTATRLGLDARRVGDQAVILLERALRQAVWGLSLDAIDLLEDLGDDSLERDVAKVLAKQPLLTESGQLFLDPGSFDQPQNTGLYLAVQRLATSWLRTLGIENWAAEAVTRRLSCWFFQALQEEWHTHAMSYAALHQEVGLSPFFSHTGARGGRWGIYLAGMLRGIDDRMGDEPFGLRDVYVPPIAYMEPSEESLAYVGQAPRRVVDLGKEILRWVYVPDRVDSVRFIAGESGAGKTSFLTALAAELAGSSLFPNEGKSRPGFPVLYIPFGQLQYQGNLLDSLRHYAARHSLPETAIPQGPEAGERLLVILDELESIPALRGSRRRMLADFYTQLRAWLEEVNAEHPRLQVLLSGSKSAWQEVPESLMRLKAMLWLLPFYTTMEAREGFRDENGLLAHDLRDTWWRGYQNARGMKVEGLPKRLRSEAARELLTRPLDCRMAATAWVEKGDSLFERPESSRDLAFQAILEKSYRRLVPSSRGAALSLEEYTRLVGECGVLSWHEDERELPGAEGGVSAGIQLATLRAHAAGSTYLTGLVQKLADVAGQELDAFFRAPFFKLREGSATGVSWSLAPEDFVDWLVAGRMAQAAERVCQLKADASRDSEEPSFEDRALVLWSRLCGEAPVHRGHGASLGRILAREGTARAGTIQTVFAHLLGYVLRHGVQMEGWHALPSVREVVRRARHVEESLLMALDAAAAATGQVSKVNWPHVDAPRTLLHRLQGGVESRGVPQAIKCLNRLDLSHGQMMGCDLIGASLEGALLSRATLRGANLAEANLTGATLVNTDLCVADLAAATLVHADLRDADLRGAILRAADLRGANLAGADLKGAVLDYANLAGADLTGADLATASLHGTDLEGATLTGTILDEEFVALAED